MNYKKILLFAASIFIIIIFFSNEIFPNNYTWLDNKILSSFGLSETDNQWDLLEFQFKHLDLEERRKARLGNPYIFCRELADYFKKEGVKNPLVLLPSQDYLKSKNIDFLMPEPIVFYYETGGYKGAWVTSANVDSTNYAVVIVNGEPTPIKIVSDEQRKELIKEYSKK